MNRAITLSCALLGGIVVVCTNPSMAETTTAIPQAHTLNRYASLWEKSPFSPESVVPETVSNTQWL
ncbi:MAG: hypothetical protein AAF571_15600, partial [Verrucomicrobiota bacterium]